MKDKNACRDGDAVCSTRRRLQENRGGSRGGRGQQARIRGHRVMGSISAAGLAAGMSYRHAWLLVDELNGLFAQPVVATQTGGSGGASLTPLGHDLVRHFRT